MTEIVISIFLILGTFVVFSGTLGVLRFPDVYSRLHAATKSATLGVSGILIGSFLFFLFVQDLVSGKLLLGIVFVLLTAPVGGHMISRAAYRSGVPLSEKTIQDELNSERDYY
ncbi:MULTISPECIES: monovalent cation/H(+) antiporter subunit G [Fictibacillus]|uniref:Cation:proton antiporter n=1 Tax=Fictibacillus enclensis TaxID=1017270 RepID=A0A0V8JFK0_9BACL|nr:MULTISPECIES: monovalent cation/H(+) antiporter subunit G [Fictibacillus]KSU85842.1 cation:proton antiporter [Fictibacillus enclensis]RXY98441.1 Na+/H+ antiporter subunit G [Fictibacillus sp. S7]